MARFLIRLDDACETSDFEKWNLITDILIQKNIRPIVAVIPENRDLQMHYSEPNDQEFYNLIKKWKLNNWTIAQHGCYHIYHKVNALCSFHPINNFSEFSSLNIEQQLNLIDTGSKLMSSKGIPSNIFVFPGHHFDYNSIRAIKKSMKIDYISDGFFLFPMKIFGLKFIPQQLWDFRKRFFGIWTINLHPNTMQDIDFDILSRMLETEYFKRRITSTDNIKITSNPFLIAINFIFLICCNSLYLLKRFLKITFNNR